MTFTKDLLERIDDNHWKKLKESKYQYGLGLNVRDCDGVVVCRDNRIVCKVSELTHLIDELIDIRQSILEETRIEF